MRSSRFVAVFLSVVLCASMVFGCSIGPKTRTIMMYGIGSNLESARGALTFNLQQMTESELSSDVRVIVMTGGTSRWIMPEGMTVDGSGAPVEADPSVKQIWEIRKTDSGENKMVLLEDMTSLSDLYMTDQACLEAFLGYCKSNSSTDLYDLILWDHGYGPLGYGNDSTYPLMDTEYDEVPMPLEQVAAAIKSADFGDSLELLDFDACLMSNVEVLTALAGTARYMVASAEQVPEFGQYYTDWISAVSADPSMSGFEIGKKIVDDTIAFYNSPDSVGYGRPCTMAVMDMDKVAGSLFGPVAEYTSLLASDAFTGSDADTFYSKFLAAHNAHPYQWDGIYDLTDMAAKLASGEDQYSAFTSQFNSVLADDDIFHFGHTRDITDSCGMSLFFPTGDAKNCKRYILAMESLRSYIDSGAYEDKEVRLSILDNQIRIATGYGLVRSVGYAVSDLVSRGSDNVTFDSVKGVWSITEQPSAKSVEYAHEHGAMVDTEGLRSPWDNGVSVLVDRAAGFLGGSATSWIDSVAARIADEVRSGNNCELPSSGISGDLTIRSERKYIEEGTVDEKTEPYDAVIGNMYFDSESDITDFDGTWYALSDVSGHKYLTSLITTAAAPGTGTIVIVMHKPAESYDGTPYFYDVEGAITTAIEDGNVRITGIYEVEAGEYKEIDPEVAAASTFYTGYRSGGYGIFRLSPDSELDIDASAPDLGLSVVSMKMAEMDDVDRARLATVGTEYRHTNIYGYTSEAG